MSDFLDEDDLKSIFSGQETQPTPAPPPPGIPLPEPPAPPKTQEKVYAPEKFTWHVLVRFLGLFVCIFIVSYLVINAPAVYKKFNYTWDVSLLKKPYSKALATPTPNPFNPTSEARIVIPKIGVDAPISWNVTDTDMKTKLLEGVAHSEGTALPGAIGNIFITGHSSYYSWVDSPYKDVFALLDKLDSGDKVYIKYSSDIFTYDVQSSKVVAPSDVSVMDQGNQKTLTLMTCVPIGTNLNRLVITAVQSSP